MTDREPAVSVEPGMSHADIRGHAIDLAVRGRLDEAAAAFFLALAVKSDAETWTDLGGVLFRMERVVEAVAAYRAALRAEPDFTPAFRYLAEALARQGRLEAAADAHGRWFERWISGDTGADLRGRQERAIASGLGSLLIVAMQKSGSEYMLTALAAALDLAIVYPSVGTVPRDRAVPEVLAWLGRGGAIARTHMDGAPPNRAAIRDAGIGRFVLHVRDPRQAALSWAHMMAGLDDQAFAYGREMYTPAPPVDFRARSLPEQVAWTLEHYYPGVVRWLDSWLADDAPEGAVVTTYDALREAPDRFLADVAAGAGATLTPDGVARLTPPVAWRNYRRGEPAEWRRALSPDQRARAWDVLPGALADRLGWTR